MSVLIKPLGGATAIEPLLLERERDLINQINRALTERDAVISRLAAILKVGFPVVAGRVVTDGVGGIASSDVVGGAVSISGTDVRVTFDEPRPEGPNGVRYLPFAMALTGGNSRIYTATNISQPAFCDFRLRNTSSAMTVDVSATIVNMALFVLDRA